MFILHNSNIIKKILTLLQYNKKKFGTGLFTLQERTHI